MTMRDRSTLQRAVETIARYQRKNALPDKRTVADPALSAAQDLVRKYGPNQNAAEVIAEKTGVTKKQAEAAVKKAVAELPKVNFDDPKYRYKERVRQLLNDGLTQEQAEECVRNVILTKEQALPAPVGREVEASQLIKGQRFHCSVVDEKGQEQPSSFNGVVLYKTPSRVRVLTDVVDKKQKNFTRRSGEEVTITSSGRVERNIAPSTTVTVLEGMEDVSALLQSKTPVQSVTDSSSISSEENEDNMAKKKVAKKSAAKSNGAAAGSRPRFSDTAVVKRLKGPVEDSIKRHVDILETLKENGDKMTVAHLAKEFGKRAKTKQDPLKVFGMHRKALLDGGFISITEPKEASA